MQVLKFASTITSFNLMKNAKDLLVTPLGVYTP